MPSNHDDQLATLSRFQNVTVIGAGVIGSSWAALFLAHGLKVVVNDPRPDIETVVSDDLRKITPTLHALGLPPPISPSICALRRTSSAPSRAPIWSRKTARSA